MGRKRKEHTSTEISIFRVWAGILARCYTPGCKDYKKYGAVGVRVCDEWRYNFKTFYNWCLENKWQKELQIDKDIIPKKIGIPPVLYSPETCSIVTCKENNNNRKSNRPIEYNGETKNIKQWAQILGINRVTLSDRLKTMSINDAFTTPLNKKYSKSYNYKDDVSANQIINQLN